jgi:AraC-like DNA-binding protein
MTPKFSIVSNGDLDFRVGFPQDYSGPILPGGKFFSGVTDYGQVTIQELTGENYSLRYQIFHFFQKISLQAESARQGLHTRFMLKNNIQHSLKGIGKIHLREGQFATVLSSLANCISRFEKDTIYQSLDIFYSPSLLQHLAGFFPELEIIIAMQPDHPILLANARRIIPSMKDVIREILECSFDKETSQFYFDLKIREILFLMLNDTYYGHSSRLKLSAFETARIQEARNILLKDITKKPITIPELAKRVNINEFKLKKGFRELFGTSIFECLLEARMEKARELLLTTDKPIKAICSESGYPRITNFITAFRRKYGYTPGSLRRK